MPLDPLSKITLVITLPRSNTLIHQVSRADLIALLRSIERSKSAIPLEKAYHPALLSLKRALNRHILGSEKGGRVNKSDEIDLPEMISPFEPSHTCTFVAVVAVVELILAVFDQTVVHFFFGGDEAGGAVVCDNRLGGGPAPCGVRYCDRARGGEERGERSGVLAGKESCGREVIGWRDREGGCECEE